MEDLFLYQEFKNEADIKDCKVRGMQSDRIIICFSYKPTCPYFFKFGNDKFCQHDLIKEVVKRKHKKDY
ncbi:MAG: hypothetical protein ABR980_04820 [Ignavibacteriaceae bacterium]|jgi:sugar-specific transcriptional regulator TrmB